MVTPSGLEPETPVLKARCSSQLSYKVILLSLEDSNLHALSQSQMNCHYSKGQYMVGKTGLEPMTFCVSDRRSKPAELHPNIFGGKGGNRTHMTGFSVQRIDQLCYLPFWLPICQRTKKTRTL